MVKNPLANAGDIRDTHLIPGLGRSGGGHGTHSSILAWRIPLDRGAWWATVHRLKKSQTRLKLLSMHTHMINLNVSYKRITSTPFPVFSCVCCFLKIISLK